MGATPKRKMTPSDQESIKSLQGRLDVTGGTHDAEVPETLRPETAIGRASGSRSGLRMLRVVARHRPTEIGDVLVLHTSRSYTVYAVGAVTVSGQRDFRGSSAVTHMSDHASALRAAKSRVAPSRRIHLLDMDTGDWSEATE
jgi:hypothetical protein